MDTDRTLWHGRPVWDRHACLPSHFSRVRLRVTPWTMAGQAALSRQEYCYVLLQGTFPTQALDPRLLGLLRRRWSLLLAPPGKLPGKSEMGSEQSSKRDPVRPSLSRASCSISGYQAQVWKRMDSTVAFQWETSLKLR